MLKWLRRIVVAAAVAPAMLVVTIFDLRRSWASEHEIEWRDGIDAPLDEWLRAHIDGEIFLVDIRTSPGGYTCTFGPAAPHSEMD